MRVIADTDRLAVLVFVDGRHTTAKKWQHITEQVAREFPGANTLGAWVMTDDPNVRPYRKKGQCL